MPRIHIAHGTRGKAVNGPGHPQLLGASPSSFLSLERTQALAPGSGCYGFGAAIWALATSPRHEHVWLWYNIVTFASRLVNRFLTTLLAHLRTVNIPHNVISPPHRSKQVFFLQLYQPTPAQGRRRADFAAQDGLIGLPPSRYMACRVFTSGGGGGGGKTRGAPPPSNHCIYILSGVCLCSLSLYAASVIPRHVSIR